MGDATDDDPFSCFGDSSSSTDGEENNHNLDASSAANLEAAHRLKEISNSTKLVGMAPITNDTFEIFDAGPSFGMGVRATAAFKCGREILRESAAMIIPNSQSASSLEAAQIMHRRAVQRAYNSMHHTTQAAFMDLSSCNETEFKTPHGIYDTNSFQLGNDNNDGGLFLTIARLNHSCRPNVSHFWSENLQQTLVLATRDIEIGEELFTSYGPSECMSTNNRREYLNDRFAFQCHCQMCLEGNTNGGDERMAEIKSLQEGIAFSSTTTTTNGATAAALESVEKCLALMEEQGIGGGVFTKSIFHHGYHICVAAGDDEGAMSYLVNELKAVQDSEGIDSPKAIEIKQMLDA